MNKRLGEIERADILNADALTIRELLQQKKITSKEVTEIYIKQIQMKNPTTNSVIETRFDDARKEAEQADIEISRGITKGKLHGIPISMKESFHVQGMKTTGGLTQRKNVVMNENADVVQKLIDEGAIILGKTNTPELCFCQETNNKLYGRTNNPRDLTRTVGGSSGGEAAVIAYGGATFGIASDIGGSIRLPAHFNGIVGFKSGNNQVSAVGSYPVEEHPLQLRMLGIGPVTKSVRDASYIYSMIANEIPEEKDVSEFTINILPETIYPLKKETRHYLNGVYNGLRKHFYLEREEPPYFHDSATLWQEIMSINGGAMAKKEIFTDEKEPLYNEYLKEITRKTASNHRYLLWALIGANMFKPSSKRIKEIEKIVHIGDERLKEYLNKRILVFPVYHSSAPKHGKVYQEIFSIRKTFKKYMPYLAYANVWGLPSLTIPIGKDDQGLPIGVQLMSKNGNEHALFQLGEIFEQNFAKYERVL